MRDIKTNITYIHRRLEKCSVIPLAEDMFNIGNYAGMHFQKVFNGNVTKEELNKLKRKYKLYRKEELQQQTTIDDYLF